MKHLNTKLEKFNALSWTERRTLLAAMAWLPLFWLGLRVLGLSRFQAWLQRGNPPIDCALSQDEIVTSHLPQVTMPDLRGFKNLVGLNSVAIEKLREIVRVATLVNIAAVHVPFPATCLTRSLLLGWMLRRRGVSSQLRIGVRITQGILDAHAWIECEGVPINDQPDVGEQFAPFAEILSPGVFQSS